jgi:hypothetical protein
VGWDIDCCFRAVLIESLERIADCILQTKESIMPSAPEEIMDEVAINELNEEEEAAFMGDSTPLKEEEEVINTTKKDIPLKEDAASTDDSKTDEDDEDDEEIVALRKKAFLFHHMATHPWFYMLFWPILFSFLIGFGWTQDEIIENGVNNLWIPTRGSYHDDVTYAASLGENDLGTLPTSSFAAMSIARDGGNLFTESRLTEITARMQKTERTTVREQLQTGGKEEYLACFCIRNLTHYLHYVTDRTQGHHLQLGRLLLEQCRLSLRIPLCSLVSHGFVPRIALVL